MGALAISLSRLGGTVSQAVPALIIGCAGLLGAAYFAFTPNQRLSRSAVVAIELLPLVLALFFSAVVMASRAG
jgi:hypothetical protein